MKKKSKSKKQTDEYFRKKPSVQDAEKYRRLNPLNPKIYEPLEDFEKRSILKRVLALVLFAAVVLVWWCVSLNASRAEIDKEYNEHDSISQEIQEEID